MHLSRFIGSFSLFSHDFFAFNALPTIDDSWVSVTSFICADSLNCGAFDRIQITSYLRRCFCSDLDYCFSPPVSSLMWMLICIRISGVVEIYQISVDIVKM